MKIIFLTLAIYAHACVVLGASTAKSSPVARGLEDIIENKCFENSHSKKAFRNLQEAIVDYHKCARRAQHQEPPHPVEQHKEFCRYFETNEYYSCMKNLAINVLPCLDKSEIFLPHMILKAYNTTFDTFCGSLGLLKTEYIFNKLQKNKSCIQEAFWTIIAEKENCIENLTLVKNWMQNIVDFNQHDYCIDMESFLDCATEVVEQNCDEDFSIIKLHISDLFLKVC